MPNTNGYNPYPGNDLDALIRELEEEGAGIIEQSNASFAEPQAVPQPAYAPAQDDTYTAQPMQTAAAAQSQRSAQQASYAQRSRIKMTNGYAFSFGDEPQPAQQPQLQPQQPETAAERKKPTAPVPSLGKRVCDGVLLLLLVAVFTVAAMIMLPSGIKRSEITADQKNFFEDLQLQMLTFKSDSVSAIYDLPKIYKLAWNELPAPEPDPAGYGSETAEDGSTVLTYNDETISVRYWTERLYQSTAHFAEVTIAHPTQLRTAFAGGEYSDSVKYMPMDIAEGVNAVIAMNGDFYNYRKNGVIIRQNTLYRNTPTGWDLLLIDSEGDFHIMSDWYVESSGILEEYEIVNTLEFGPSLVIDGKVNLINPGSGCGPNWNEKHFSPRAAIGQIGKLHYLFCVVEGRSDESRGVLTSQMAQIMLDKGCVMAYNLDGGQSATLMLDAKPLNVPLWNNQREVSDIIYCATAIPNEEVPANE